MSPSAAEIPRALKQPDANAKFTGKAIGMVTQYRGSTLDKPNQQHFENGNATLSINGARNGGDLLLEFPDFYDIAFQIKLINNNDEFENTSQAPTVTPNGGGTPFRFPGTIEDYKRAAIFMALMVLTVLTVPPAKPRGALKSARATTPPTICSFSTVPSA